MTLDQQLAYLTKGCVDVLRVDDLRTKLARAGARGRPLTVKVGFDPTAPDLHLGHTVLIRKMRHFQQLGHRVVFVIGDFTGLIGDPTGRSKTRPPLTPEEIAANAETYKAQVFTLLDPVATVVEFNSRWLGALTGEGWVRLAARYNVAQMLERRDFKQRFEAGQPIALHEFLYPLAQAYDSVALEADVELGGTDQLFNLNVGRDIMPSFGLEAQVVMTVPLLVGLDGVEKMSKSLGNYVGVAEPAQVIVEKIVERFHGTDTVLWEYFTLLTDLAPEEIEARRAAVERGDLSASDARYQLARLLATDFHGADAAAEAEEAVRARHRLRQQLAAGGGATGELPSDVHLPALDVVLSADGSLNLARAVADLKFAPSASEAARQIKAGGVKVDGVRATEVRWVAAGAGEVVLAVGARKLARLRLLPPRSPSENSREEG
ncbi:MAG: tyrosine--tRNA ligase [Vicinamibacteraceae bacterium]|nr:tyrosine--tRNA ligase [Vicinamibacteraceae bacterium]